jgi:hypothetical protein
MAVDKTSYSHGVALFSRGLIEGQCFSGISPDFMDKQWKRLAWRQVNNAKIAPSATALDIS